MMPRYSLIHIAPHAADGEVNLRMPEVVRHSTTDDLKGLKILADTWLKEAAAEASIRQDIFEEGGARIFRLGDDGEDWQEVGEEPVNA